MMVYLVSSKMMNQCLRIFEAVGKIFVTVNGQILNKKSNRLVTLPLMKLLYISHAPNFRIPFTKSL